MKNYFRKNFPQIFEKVRKLIKGNKKLSTYVNNVAINSFAQYQEDLVINSFFSNKNTGTYVDIGAYDPDDLSNTKLFFLKGWSGVNIDPNFSTIELFKKKRPNDTNLNLGVSIVDEKKMFYEMDPKSLSTFNEKEAILNTRTYQGAKIVKKYEVQCLSLKTILSKYTSVLDFMSIDVEGYELFVLKSNDWDTYRPKLIIIEINRNTNEIFHFMKNINYSLIFNNETNGIFIDNKNTNL